MSRVSGAGPLLPFVGLLVGLFGGAAAAGAEPAPGIVRGPTAAPRRAPSTTVIPPRNTGPEAVAHSRYRRGRHGTTRIIRRTPAVMREDAARVKRGDLFGTWSNDFLE